MSYAYCFVAALSANKDVYTIQRRFIRAVENGNGLTLPMAWVGSMGRLELSHIFNDITVLCQRQEHSRPNMMACLDSNGTNT